MGNFCINILPRISISWELAMQVSRSTCINRQGYMPGFQCS